MTASIVDSAIASRMSTRAFTSQPVSRATIVALLQAAAQLADGGETWPWAAHVLQGERCASLCKKICEAHDAARADPSLLVHYREEYDYYPVKWVSPYIERRRENGWGLYGLLGIGKADKDKMHAQHHRNYLFFDAPVGLIFTMHRSLGYNNLPHYGRFLQNVMVEARIHGLHTCPQAAWNDFAKIILRHIGAGSDELLVCGMALGYADEKATVNSFHTPRLPVAEFTRWMD